MTGWSVLPDGVGTVLAVSGERVVAAESGRLRAWQGDRVQWVAQVPEPNPARPRLLPDRVLWGPYSIAWSDGAVTPLPAARPPAGYRQTAHAWSADGATAVLAGGLQDRSSSAPPAAAWLAEADRVELWSAADLPPVAVAVWSDAVLVGHRSPQPQQLDGRPGPLLDAAAAVVPAQRIDRGGDVLLLVTPGELAVFALSSGALIGAAPGWWVDGCVTPDGRTVIGVAGGGELLAYDVGDGLLPRALPSPADDAVAVATDGTSLVAAFRRPPGLRRCPL
jgi:hypothetical protein